ncbi:MAG: hypothetical protein JSW07_17850 [bacterium]|nr:MAG: hypothetical protein JSW07_17850 [bacterium]
MKNKMALSLAIMFLNSGIVFSQGKIVSNDFGFYIGVNEYQVKEKVLNNIRHRGFFPTLGFSYEKNNDDSKQKLEFNLVFNILKSRYDPERASFVINPSIKYRYARKVKNINQNISLFLGGISRFNSHSALFTNWDDSHIYWLTSYDLGMDFMLIYQKSVDNSFSFEINSPLVALVSRPPERFLYKVLNPKFSWIVAEFHDNLKLNSVHKHFALNMDLAYTFRYSKKFKQRLFWQFSYINNRMTYSKDISILTHTFGITFLF